MIAVTATQAARDFANILDQVERGETIVTTRDGVPVGRLTLDTASKMSDPTTTV
jgi:antitoxin (DNA-binding transcriptional repressor) of toxin-antitoxin stability system